MVSPLIRPLDGVYNAKRRLQTVNEEENLEEGNEEGRGLDEEGMLAGLMLEYKKAWQW